METHYLELSVLVVLELELLSSSESDSTVLTDSFLACKLFCLDLDCVLVCLEGRGGESPLPESGDQEDLHSGDICSPPEVSLLVMMTLLSLLIMITVVILTKSISLLQESMYYLFTSKVQQVEFQSWAILKT